MDQGFRCEWETPQWPPATSELPFWLVSRDEQLTPAVDDPGAQAQAQAADTSAEPEDARLLDERDDSVFKTTTYSGFKKLDVKKELVNALTLSQLEPACYWCAELAAAGHWADIWELFAQFVCKHVHLNHLVLAVYLAERMQVFEQVAKASCIGSRLPLRNHPDVRHMMAQIPFVLCDTKRKPPTSAIRIRPEDRNMDHIASRFEAPSTQFADAVCVEGDPKAIVPLINEFAYSVTARGNNPLHACYWVEWVYDYDARCRTDKDPVRCAPRPFVDVDARFSQDVVWVLWDALLREAHRRSALYERIVRSLAQLFAYQFSKTAAKRRKYMFHVAIELLCTPVTLITRVVDPGQRALLAQLLRNVDRLYLQLKHAPSRTHLT